MPHLDTGGVDCLREGLTAERHGRREPVPAGCGPIAIRFFPAGRRCDVAVLERRAVFVADAVEGRDHIGREFARFLEHRIHRVRVEIAVYAARRAPASKPAEFFKVNAMSETGAR